METKTVRIEGMMCMHCAARVEKALRALEGVDVKVDLEGKKAVVECASPVTDEALRAAVTGAGYEVTGIE